MSHITKNCLHCQAEFSCDLREHNRGYGKFCCQSCSSYYFAKNKPQKEPNCKCSTCGKLIYKSASKLKNSKHGYYFCSRHCKELAQSPSSEYKIEAIMPTHYGDGLYSYRNRAKKQKPLICESCGYNKYPEILEVHHIDRNRKNNTIENLKLICPTCHQEEHFLTKSGRYCGPAR